MVPGSARNWICSQCSSTIQPQQTIKNKKYDNLSIKKFDQLVAFVARFLSHPARPRLLCAFAAQHERLVRQRRSYLRTRTRSLGNDGALQHDTQRPASATRRSVLSALFSNTTGELQHGHWYFALNNNTTGGYNTAIGAAALYWNTTGNDNTANGSGALFTNTTGDANTATGYERALLQHNRHRQHGHRC